jgi:hypothetical protein
MDYPFIIHDILCIKTIGCQEIREYNAVAIGGEGGRLMEVDIEMLVELVSGGEF